MRGGILTISRVTGPSAFTRTGTRGYHGLRLEDCRLSAPAGGGGAGLTRTTSGILFFDDFNRSDRALNGDNGWVDDAGTWAIVSGLATNSSAGNFDRNRQAGLTQAAAVYEARIRAPTTSIYCGIRLLAPDATDDYHVFWQGNNGDKRLARAAASDTTIASLTMTADTSFHVVKVRYTGTRDFVIWIDHAAGVLGSLAVPFTAGAGPTAAGNPGLLSYGGAAEYDWMLVSSDHLITITGLSGTQAFRLYDASAALLGSSAVQSGGAATLSVATLFDGLGAGHIQVFDDEGTWAVPTTDGRYPAVTGVANDLAGGDVYDLA